MFNQILDGLGKLEVPQSLAPVHGQGVVLNLVGSLAGLHLQVKGVVIVVEGGFNVHEWTWLAVRVNLLRVHIPVGQKSGADQALGLGDEVAHAAGQLLIEKHKTGYDLLQDSWKILMLIVLVFKMC